MAVYWVDPYIDANVGGIHGTTETVTRTGTYSAPLSFADINNTEANNFPGLTLADGDEIRIKGLSSVSDYLIDIGNTWYISSYRHLYSTVENSTWTSEKTAKNQTGFAFMLPTSLTDRYMVANSEGTIPPFFFTGGYSTTTQIYTYSSAGYAPMWYAALRPTYYGSSNNNLQLYLVDPDYYIDVSSITGATYLFMKSGIDLKITDGWTSETVRNGVCVLPLEANNMGGSNRNFYFNKLSSNTSYGNWYDCLNTYFIALDTGRSDAYARPYFYTNSADGTYKGNTYTQKIGGIIKADGGYPTYLYNSWYYQGSDSDGTRCNNLEIGVTSSYYGAYVYGRYGDNIEYRINNLFARSNGAGYFNTYNYSTRRMDIKLGTMMTYSGQSGNFIRTTSNVQGGDAPYFTFLDSATLYGYASSDALFEYSDTSMMDRVTFGSPLINYKDYPDNFYGGNGTGPNFGVVGGKPPHYSLDINMSPTNWTAGGAVFYDGRTSTPHDLTEANLALGNLITNDSDYRNTDVDLYVKTDMYVYTSYNQSNTYDGDVNAHFSSNDYDGKPIGLMFSSSQNNAYHPPLIYYNDSAEENALVIQGNAKQTNTYYYVKKLEIPIPKYTTENIRISVNWKVSANWPTSNAQVRINVGYQSTSGWTWTSVVNSSNPASTNSSYATTTVDISNSNLPTTQLNHMKIGLDIKNPKSHQHKLYIKSIEASLV